MKNQYQNEDRISPWGFEQHIPNNILIQFQAHKKSPKQSTYTDRKNNQLANKFNRFIQKRQLRNSQKMAQKLSEQRMIANSTNTKKMQITNIQPPEGYMNETFRLSEMFPSFSLNKMQKELTFYKKKHYSIQKPESKPQAIKMLPVRYSFGSTDEQNSQQLGRYLTMGRITYHLSTIHKSFRDQATKSSICKKSLEQRQISTSNQCNQSKLKTTKKSKIYEDIIQFLQRKKGNTKLERHKTEGPIQIDKCLKSKKQICCNLPKIQFIQISQ